jgi:hypothetical protein
VSICGRPPSREIRDQPLEGLQFEVRAEDGADGLGLHFVDDERLVLPLMAEWDRAARPFALEPAGRNLVPYLHRSVCVFRNG